MNVLRIGERVQLHPCTDQWMQGDRYGEVRGFSTKGNVRVHLDRSGRTACLHPDNVIPLRDVQLREAVSRALRASSNCCLDDDEDTERVLHNIMAELSLLGIRDTVRPSGSSPA